MTNICIGVLMCEDLNINIPDHIHRWYAFLGLFDVAINHIMEVLDCSHQSKTMQELFLRDFFQIVQVLNNCLIALSENKIQRYCEEVEPS